MEKPSKASAQSVVYGVNPDEKRIGKMITPYVRLEAPGAAVGMCLHLSSGVFCGLDDTDGYTGIPGLWVSGDGVHLTNTCGGNYDNGNGFTTCFVSICADHAGKSAAAYVDTVSLEKITSANHQEAVDEIEQPLNLETGFSPMWARDVLNGIMAPYWIQKNKVGPLLEAALTQVLYMRENVAPKLLARTGHDLRMVHEVKHKINACELKLRASIARKESRGANFFRVDYPKRDDANWRKYILLTKGADGQPEMSFEQLKDEWGPAGIPADFEIN
jgi:succinate dehydrogenase/fumarate reductase flavoprotein subunit